MDFFRKWTAPKSSAQLLVLWLWAALLSTGTILGCNYWLEEKAPLYRSLDRIANDPDVVKASEAFRQELEQVTGKSLEPNSPSSHESLIRAVAIARYIAPGAIAVFMVLATSAWADARRSGSPHA